MATLIRILLLAGIIFLCSKNCQVTFEVENGSKITVQKRSISMSLKD